MTDSVGAASSRESIAPEGVPADSSNIVGWNFHCSRYLEEASRLNNTKGELGMAHQLPDLPPVAEGVFTLPPYDQFPPRLIGAICSSCNEYFFPATPYCRKCLEPTVETHLGSEGIIYSHTVIRTKAPLGLPTPYCVGYVDLTGSSLRVFFLLDPDAIGAFKTGLAVRLAVKPLGVDQQGSPCLRPCFTPQQ